MEQLIPPPSSQGVTEDEYLRREETSQTRHEFRNGSIVAMAGGTDAHSAIAANLIIEVTRESSEVDDRGDKFNQYRLVPSLAEYVLVSSLKMQVETFYKQPDGVWAIGATVSKADGVLLLRSLEMEIPLADIYAKVQLPAPVAAKTSQAEA